MGNIDLRLGDCLELMRAIPDNSVDLVLTDPPYNIGVTSEHRKQHIKHSWDKIDNYIEWFIKWINEAARILKPSGVLYFSHNDIEQIAELLIEIRLRTPLSFRSFCVWDKGVGYRTNSWYNREYGGLRMWFNTCEYWLHFFNTNPAEGAWGKTGLERIHSNPNCFQAIRNWYNAELKRLQITKKDVSKRYVEYTGRKPYMAERHYFAVSQFEIPTKDIYNNVYRYLGFSREYEDLRREYEDLRNYHRVDSMHRNIWRYKPPGNTNRYHVCQKPVSMLQRLIRVSCPEGGVVFDPFMGSGSTGVAAKSLNRDFIGIELDLKYYEIAQRRMVDVQQPLFV